jgi:lysozyme family protein
MAEFSPAFNFLLPHEGAYSNIPHDPGGPTKFGISALRYPELNIHDLTLADAETIYRRDWWEKYGYGRIDDQDIANKVFDLAVNMGPAKACKILQEACNRCGADVKVDGGLGPKTVEAVNGILNPKAVLVWMRSLAADHYNEIAEAKPQMKVFLNGWLERASA